LSFFEELKRRNVFRVAIGYIVTAWLLLQVVDLVLDNINSPDWVVQVFMLALAVGFPLAVFFAWAFEMTPEGFKRESDVDRSQSIAPQTGKKLNIMIFAVMALALAYFAVDKFVLDPTRDAEMVQAATQIIAEPAISVAPVSGTPEQSIAVLPFVNMSDDKDYFADGLSEELLNLLAKFPDLKVAGRTSSFAFKGKNEDLRTVGEALSVAHVLEGSVRRSGDRLRITAQLIKVDDGYHIWSETYDRQMADIFDIQDDVATAIADALKLHLSTTADRPTENTQAYALYLEALALSIAREIDEINQGLAILDRAIELDPRFAEAWELKATYYWQAGGWVMDNSEAQILTHEAAIKALELDPALMEARAFATAANPDRQDSVNTIEAFEALVKAEPANANAIIPLTYSLLVSGYFNEVIALADRIIELEPLATIGYLRKGEALSAGGRREEAQAVWLKASEMGGELAYWYLGNDQLIAGNDELAVDYYSVLPEFVDANPDVVRGEIQNARNPDTGKAFLDNWITESLANATTTQVDTSLYSHYLYFGYLDDYFAAIGELRGKGNAWTNAENLENEGMVFRRTGYTRHPAYLENAEADGMFDLWDRRGAPDHCQKVDSDWVCE